MSISSEPVRHSKPNSDWRHHFVADCVTDMKSKLVLFLLFQEVIPSSIMMEFRFWVKIWWNFSCLSALSCVFSSLEIRSLSKRMSPFSPTCIVCPWWLISLSSSKADLTISSPWVYTSKFFEGCKAFLKLNLSVTEFWLLALCSLPDHVGLILKIT